MNERAGREKRSLTMRHRIGTMMTATAVLLVGSGAAFGQADARKPCSLR